MDEQSMFCFSRGVTHSKQHVDLIFHVILVININKAAFIFVIDVTTTSAIYVCMCINKCKSALVHVWYMFKLMYKRIYLCIGLTCV